MTKHSKFSPSSAHRWMRCTGSVRLIAELEEDKDKTTSYANEGRLAHHVAALGMDGKNTAEMQGKELNGFKGASVNQEMINYVDDYLTYIHKKKNSAVCSRLFIEYPVDFSNAVDYPDCFGTADAVIVNPFSIHVIDFKYGKGVPVSAVYNEQLMLYALGVYDYFKPIFIAPPVIHLSIFQPRAKGISEWSTTLEYLNEFAQQSRSAIRIAISKDAKIVPGDIQCKFCNAKYGCYGYSNRVISMFDDLGFNSDTEYKVEKLSEKDLVKLLPQIPKIESWCKVIKEYALRRALSGDDIEGYRLTMGRKGNRTWSSEDLVKNKLRNLGIDINSVSNTQLKSPTQLEKYVTKEIMDELMNLTIQSDGKYTLEQIEK